MSLFTISKMEVLWNANANFIFIKAVTEYFPQIQMDPLVQRKDIYVHFAGTKRMKKFLKIL